MIQVNVDGCERMPAQELQPFQRNLKSLSEESYAQLRDSIKAEGFVAPVFVWKNKILDGHQRLRVIEREGWEIDGGVPVVKIKAKDEQEAARRLLAIAGSYGRVDGEGLAEMAAYYKIDLLDMPQIDLPNFDMEQFLLDHYADPNELAGLTDEDDIPEIPDDPITQPGDLWLLGNHRVLCGDATSVDDVQRLLVPTDAVMITDPPYNVGLDYTETTDDEKSEKDYKEFSQAWFDLWASLTARQVVTPGGVNLPKWYRWFDVYHCAPWIKLNAMTNGKISRFWCWEPVLFFGTGWRVGRKSRPSDVFDFSVGMQKDTGSHPCPKPVKLWVELIEKYTDEGSAIAEPFGGSGTTLIAAEKTGRICYATELDPGYTDLQVQRWQDYTGKEATLESTGATFEATGRELALAPAVNFG